jgi:type I restriction enzyme S subunit
VTSRRETRTGGRPASTGVIPGTYALSVGRPEQPPPPGWKWTALTDVARLETGHTPSRRQPEYWDGDVPWVGIKDATENHGRVIYDTYQHTNKLGIANSSARILPANTVCLSRTASVGYVVVMGKPMATSQDFVNWVCSQAIDYRFLKYVLLAEREAFLRFASGTTHQTIYFPEVKAFHVCLPSIEEQRAIAHILGTLDDKIELNRRMNKTLEGTAQAIFKSWFVDFDPVRAKAQGRDPDLTRHIADLFPDGFENSELGEIPAGWDTAALSEVMDVNPRRTLKKGEVAPYLDMKNMPTQSARAMHVYNRGFGSGARFVDGDTLVARITPCLENGKTCFVDFLGEGNVGWGSTEYIVLRPNRHLPTEFAYFLARTEGFRTYAISNMSGTSGRQRVPAASLDQFVIAVPPIKVAEVFGKTARTIMNTMKVKDEESRTLVAIRDALLPKLVSGKLRVPNANQFIERHI